MSEISEHADDLIDDFEDATVDSYRAGAPSEYEHYLETYKALFDYIATLEAEVAALKPYRDGYDPKVTPPTKEGKYIFGYRNGHVNMSWSFGKPDEFTQDDIVRWWPLPEVER